jgi:hypothetical protein
MTTSSPASASVAPPPDLSALGQEALRLHQVHGWNVFPVAEGAKKPPKVKWEPYQAIPVTPELIIGWWRRWPNANIGVVTGRASGLVVLDVDIDDTPGEEIDGWASLQAIGVTDLPDTPKATTPRGGTHALFQYPEDDEIANFVGRLPGIDLRAEGGYFVAPPSVRADGACYQWTVAPEEVELAPIPDWLMRQIELKSSLAPRDDALAQLDALLGQVPASGGLDATLNGGAVHDDPLAAADAGRLLSAPQARGWSDVSKNYAQTALADEIGNVTKALPGTRNATLNRAAFKLGTFVGAGLLNEALVTQLLEGAGQVAGLDAKETQQTVRSGLSAGKASPRPAPPATLHRANGVPPVNANDASSAVVGGPVGGGGGGGNAHPAADHRPTIDITHEDHDKIAPQAWDAIVAQNNPPFLFQHSGKLVELESAESSGFRQIDFPRMRTILWKSAHWVRKGLAGKGVASEREVVPISAIVDACLGKIDPRIPALAKVVRFPIFTPDGELLTTPGYHDGTGIYYSPQAKINVPPVSPAPTEAEMQRARSLMLDELLVDFPFVSEADRAHAVALFLLPFVRELISGPTPLHLVEAPTMGSGKGLLAEVLLTVALGEKPRGRPEATSDDEWRKVITSELLNGPTAIYIDNLNRTLDSASLASALTAHVFGDRVLGQSRTSSSPVRCVWVATGNNPTLSTEIARRCIRIRIDPHTEDPWLSRGALFKHPELRTWTAQNRDHLIWAALTLTRYGLQHGIPDRRLGSYENWSDVIGRILNGCGVPCFLGNLETFYSRSDAESAAWRALLGAWWYMYGDTPQFAGELYRIVAGTNASELVNGKDEDGRKFDFVHMRCSGGVGERIGQASEQCLRNYHHVGLFG